MLMAATPRRGEQGFSLVESVIAVAILGIIVSAMVGGMATSIATSNIHRQQSVANTVMVSAAERVKSAPYKSCDSVSPDGKLPAPLTYQTAAQAALPIDWPSGAWITVSVQYWNPTANTPAFDSTCHDTETGGDGLGGPFPMQLVTIRVTNPGSTTSTSVAIVKRSP